MKIVFGTPRSGTTFFTRYLFNKYPNCEYLGEHFQPYYFKQDDTVENRLASLKNNSLFKVHIGKELDIRVLDIIKHNPVNVVIRKNKLEQIVSMGLASIADKWVTYNNNETYTSGYYKKEWFDDIVYRIEQFDILYPKLNVSNIFYYEDIPTYPNNGKLPFKQNKYTLEQSLNMFDNKQEVLEWYNDWIK